MRPMGMIGRAGSAMTLVVIGIVVLPTPRQVVGAADASTWYWQNPLPRAYSLSAIVCRSLNACVAVGSGGSIVTTDDGGRRWTNRNSGTTVGLQRVTCPSRLVCYASGGTWGTPTGTARAVILKSVDGGKTWRRQLLRQHRGNMGLFFASLTCGSATLCLAAPGATSPDAMVYRTADGGKTWRTVHVASGGGVGDVTCATASVCYGMNGLSRTVVRSLDGGKTWKLRATVPRPTVDVLQRMTCPGPMTCFVTSSICCIDDIEGDIYLTRDGARTWKRVDHLSGVPIYDVKCPSLSTCYVSADRVIVATSDGGRTWRSHRTSDPPGAIACPGLTTCYTAATVTNITDSTTMDIALPHREINP